jgi:hypothetical protein
MNLASFPHSRTNDTIGSSLHVKNKCKMLSESRIISFKLVASLAAVAGSQNVTSLLFLLVANVTVFHILNYIYLRSNCC